MNRFAVLASLIVLVVLVLVAVGVPAAVARPAHSTHPAHPVHPAERAHPARGNSGETGSCAALDEGYYGSQPFTLTNARVRLGKGVSKSALAAGDRVVRHGETTVLPHGCSTTGFAPAITVRYVRITAADAGKH